MYYQAFQRGQDALREVLNSLAGLYEDNLFLFNLQEFLESKPKVIEPSHPQPIPQLKQKGIQFHHVSFQYPSSNRKGLEDISLTIQPGEVVALVGENGAGKTTLIKLLCRLYDPTAGTITFEGVDLKDLATDDLRRQISIVFQDYAKYHLTANENIWLGNIDLPPHDEHIEKAARKAGADDVIKSLPKGYETMLGNWFEDGEELSIGQWQKIALARAFLRDAQIIVLDEPTSALDPKAEAQVFEKFRQLLEGQSAILISHRLSTIKMADRIYLLEHGTITESGTHQELMQLGGTYAHLFETQAQHYR
jgi:ATP-binding cassette subfamily B protein